MIKIVELISPWGVSSVFVKVKEERRKGKREMGKGTGTVTRPGMVVVG